MTKTWMEKQEKRELQEQIKSTLWRHGHRQMRPFTVAVMGTVGVGKSSLINTIATAMSNERWQEHALTGHHGGQAEPMTAYTSRYPQCCREAEHRNPLIPTLLDIGGLPDQLDETWSDVLHMVFNGRVPEKQSLQDVHDYLQIREDTRKPRFDITHDRLKVDRVLVVSSATEEIPENLLRTIVKAARPLRGPEGKSIPIFGVMTKVDLIETETTEDFQRREKLFKDILGLGGAETRYLCCSNYCGAVDPENKRIQTNIPKLDVPILRLMTQICDPVINVVSQELVPWWQQIPTYVLLLVLIALVQAVLAVL